MFIHKNRDSLLLHNIWNPIQLILNIFQRSDLGLRLLQIEPPGIVGVKLINQHPLGVAVAANNIRE